MPTRALEDVSGWRQLETQHERTRFGGLAGDRRKATGFFRTERIGDRWWMIDPEGGLFHYRGIASVRPTPTPGADAALREKFQNEAGWASATARHLIDHGFNAVGCWSKAESFSNATPRLAYTVVWNFMSAYGKERGGTFQKPGHTGYPKNCIFVFDPEFVEFCDRHAAQLARVKSDPWLVGHFSDNEMPLPLNALTNYLELPQADSGYQQAVQWLQKRRGNQATMADIQPADLRDFQELIVERYYSIVSKAIRKHDPNHLYLGSRFHGADLRYPQIFRAAGRYADVIAVNYYRAWTPDLESLRMWNFEAGKPILITEWYAKGEDSGMGNTGGAGWLVKTQRDRGLFYQNFVLALLESKVCVGWDWFKYMDNDPADKRADPSNVDSNKGIVNNRYVPYEPLLTAMKDLNLRAEGLIESFDATAPK